MCICSLPPGNSPYVEPPKEIIVLLARIIRGRQLCLPWLRAWGAPACVWMLLLQGGSTVRASKTPGESYPKRSCKSAFFLNRCCSHTCYCELLRGSFSMELSFTTLLLFLCKSRGARMHQRRMPLHFPSMH